MTSTKTRNAVPDDEDPEQSDLNGHQRSKDSGLISSRFSSVGKMISLTQEEKMDRQAERILKCLKLTRTRA